MGKNKYFTGQPILNQLLSMLDREDVNRIASKQGSDHYYKHFKTYNHLVTMLYSVFSNCTSSREVVSGMRACSNKLAHLGIFTTPARSTLCDANKKRCCEVFEQIYRHLYNKFQAVLPDSRSVKDLYILDSTTITLFQQIMKAAGRPQINGRRKGGIKVHTLLKAAQDVPVRVAFSSGAAHDVGFLKLVPLQKGATVTFDKGYIDYRQYEQWSQHCVYYVTRLKHGAQYQQIGSFILNSSLRQQGVIDDQLVMLGHTTHKQVTRTKARIVHYRHLNKAFYFLTNNFELSALQVAQTYKRRWQIEMLFKRIKQNFPLKYFLGDNENAIKIQIWCVLIADLLLKVLSAKLTRKWAYANLVAIVRLHLMSYISLMGFLNDPDKFSQTNNSKQKQLSLFNIGLYDSS